jgi:hypothetical protein
VWDQVLLVLRGDGLGEISINLGTYSSEDLDGGAHSGDRRNTDAGSQEPEREAEHLLAYDNSNTVGIVRTENSIEAAPAVFRDEACDKRRRRHRGLPL